MVMQSGQLKSKDMEDTRNILTFAAGLNENQTPDLSEAWAGYNFELSGRNTKLIPRPPFDFEGQAPNTGPITGINQMFTRAGVKTTLVTALDKVYLWAGGGNFTEKATVVAPALLRDTYWSLSDLLIINDVTLNNPVKQWDGTTFENLRAGASPIGTTHLGTPVITGLSSTAGLKVGQNASGVGLGTTRNTVFSVDSSSQVTLTLNSTLSGNVSILFGTNVITGTTTAGSPVITGLSGTTLITPGMAASGPGINVGGVTNQILSIDSPSQVTLTLNSTANGTGTIVFGLGTALYAKYSIVWNDRVWYFNVTAGTATPHLMLASYLNDPQTVDLTNRGGPSSAGGGLFPTGQEAFYLLTPDLKEINGVSVYQNQLLISTKFGQIFVLTGSDPSTYNFTPLYTGSAALGDESMISTGNDVMYMRLGGNIDGIQATQNYGDVRAADLSLWIPESIKNVKSCLTAYDQLNQKVYFFIGNKVLVLFKDILYNVSTVAAPNSGKSPWSVYTTSHPSNFNCQAVSYIMDPDPLNDNLTIIWGDAGGNLFDMNGTGLSGDAGAYPINMMRKTRLIDMEVLNPWPFNEINLAAKVQYRRVSGPSQMEFCFDWSDELNESCATVTLKGGIPNGNGVYYGGTALFGGGSYWNQQPTFITNVITHTDFSPVGKGPGFYMTINCTSNFPWQVDHVEFY